jgi:hypothetical protein
MKTLIKSALVALAITGAAVAGTATPTPANAAVAFAIGPDGAHVAFSNGYYYDNGHRRHYYRYPREYRNYGHPRSWYRTHPNWHRTPNWWR